MRRFFSAFLLTAALLLPSLHAELVFDKEHLEFHPGPEAETVTAKFTFTQTGEHPIDVVEVDANCGCIEAKADKDRYEKGEKGEISFVFSLGQKEGPQTNTVWIAYTEDTGKPPASPGELGPSGEDPNEVVAPTVKKLTVHIDIPVIVAIDPKMTTWTLGTELEPREVLITMHHTEPIRLVKATSSRPEVAAELREIQPGVSYAVTLTPTNPTGRQLMGMLTLETDSSLARQRKKLAFFRFAAPRPPLPAAAAPSPPEGKSIPTDPQ